MQRWLSAIRRGVPRYPRMYMHVQKRMHCVMVKNHTYSFRQAVDRSRSVYLSSALRYSYDLWYKTVLLFIEKTVVKLRSQTASRRILELHIVSRREVCRVKRSQDSLKVMSHASKHEMRIIGWSLSNHRFWMERLINVTHPEGNQLEMLYYRVIECCKNFQKDLDHESLSFTEACKSHFPE